ncbi:hypothetical protein NQ314_017107 [Rhamnusium bicolor]|uniref:Uncharacterized protein n=1 Tax=Rhamnusium bicolor TaxID=1586634 RepID=A0AAV8WV64_9CUCU|nr:hypothetical protein NQ314_017107 [Rhamnusium bicolor]
MDAISDSNRQLVFPKLPVLPVPPGLSDLPKLPTPQKFIEELLNVAPNELLDVVSSFAFDDILSHHIQFFLYNKNGSITKLDTYSDKPHIENISEPIKFIIHGWQSKGNNKKTVIKSGLHFT